MASRWTVVGTELTGTLAASATATRARCVTATELGSDVDAPVGSAVRSTICWAGVNSPIIGSAARPKE